MNEEQNATDKQQMVRCVMCGFDYPLRCIYCFGTGWVEKATCPAWWPKEADFNGRSD